MRVGWRRCRLGFDARELPVGELCVAPGTWRKVGKLCADPDEFKLWMVGNLCGRLSSVRGDACARRDRSVPGRAGRGRRDDSCTAVGY